MSNLNKNMSLTEMITNQEKMVENMINAISNNNVNLNKNPNMNVNNMKANKNQNMNVNTNNKKNNNNKNFVEITISHPENNKKMTFKIHNEKTMEDLQKLLQKEAQVSLKKYHMLLDNGENDLESMKKVGKDTKLTELHKKKVQFKEKNRVYTLTEPLIKFRMMHGKVIDQENKFGKFDGKYPSVAARKAATSIMQSMRYEVKDIFNLPEF